MLKNLSPLLSGSLLSALDRMQEGDFLNLVGTGYPNDEIHTPVIDLGEVTTEAAAEAILSVFPLAGGQTPPLAFLDCTGGNEEWPDVAFAVSGIASDSELRRVSLMQLGPAEFFAVARTAVVTVRVGSSAPPCAFLLCKGAC